MKITEQLAVANVLTIKLHEELLNVPEPLLIQVTTPVGGLAAPAEMSETVAVQVVA